MSDSAILSTQQLSIGYRAPRRDDVLVASGLDLSLRVGELACLLGPNGVGKSTLLRTLAGMQKPLSGRVMLEGKDVHAIKSSELARILSIVLTERVNAGMMTGYALVALGRHPHTGWTGQMSAHDEAMVVWAIEAVGAQDLQDKPIAEMSDGQRQKLMIARALAQDPALMILDEPTAYLDLPRRVEVMRLLRQLAHETGRAVLLSTHDLDLALRTADVLWLMPLRRDIQVGSPEDLVLNGAFEATFASEGVRFDASTGTFVLGGKSQGTVYLIGEGLRLEWTRRAVERSGLSLVNAPGSGTITIHVEPERWLISSANGEQYVDNLYELVSQLRSGLSDGL